MKEGDQARTQADFSEAVLARSKGVMVELWLVLGVYRESMTLIGGWAPYFIVEKFGRKEDDFRHIGSIDIDVALDPEKIDSEAYESIAKLLSQRGYKPRADKLGDPIPFSFERDVLEDFPPIQIDFLGPEYGGSGKSHRFQKVQEDFKVRKARGADVVLTSRFTQSIETILPNGASEIAEIYIADAVGSITTKAMARGHRPCGLLWCRGRDSNPYARRHGPLKTACLPVSPPRLNAHWQEWRDSNPRPTVLETVALAN